MKLGHGRMVHVKGDLWRELIKSMILKGRFFYEQAVEQN